jgi:integrase
MKLTVTAIYDRRKKLTTNLAEKAPIEIQVYQSQPRLRKYLSTGISIEQAFWDNEKKQVRTKHPNAPHYNKIIRNAIHGIEDYAYTLAAQKKALTDSLLTDFINGQKANSESFTQFFAREIDPALKRGTRKEHEYTFNMLKVFKSDILFSEINYSLVQELDRYMRFEKGFMQNTIHKHHAHINRFLRLAGLKELFDPNKNPYNSFKSKKEKSDRISLTLDEIKAIEAIYTQAYPELIVVKDMFLFSCYTGLRFSDITTLEHKHLVNSPEGLTIVKKMEKVSKPITLPLMLLFNGKPYNILHKYLSSASGCVFPPVTNQHANRLLKVIATLAKTPMRLTFHIARHTFGTMLADTTQNPYLIMDLMGHADIKTSMIYIHRSQERINKQLREVKWV